MTWLIANWKLVLVGVALAFSHFFVFRSGKAIKGVEFEQYKVAQHEARILADRAREQLRAARQAAIDKVAHDAQAQIAKLETERGAAADAAERLRQARDAAVERARRASCTASPSPGQPDTDPVGLLALVLERADRRAGIVSEYADRLRVAGAACEAAYDEIATPARAAAP